MFCSLNILLCSIKQDSGDFSSDESKSSLDEVDLVFFNLATENV